MVIMDSFAMYVKSFIGQEFLLYRVWNILRFLWGGGGLKIKLVSLAVFVEWINQTFKRETHQAAPTVANDGAHKKTTN